MFLTRICLQALLTMDLLKARFLPWLQSTTNPKPWPGSIEDVCKAPADDLIYLDRETGHWYLWGKDTDAGVWTLYRYTTLSVWQAYMASCTLAANYLEAIQDGKPAESVELNDASENAIRCLLNVCDVKVITTIPIEKP